MLQEMIDASQATVNGVVRLRLYKGNVVVAGRKSARDSLFDMRIATFEEDKGATTRKTGRFYQAQCLRLRIAARLGRKIKLSR